MNIIQPEHDRWSGMLDVDAPQAVEMHVLLHHVSCRNYQTHVLGIFLDPGNSGSPSHA